MCNKLNCYKCETLNGIYQLFQNEWYCEKCLNEVKYKKTNYIKYTNNAKYNNLKIKINYKSLYEILSES